MADYNLPVLLALPAALFFIHWLKIVSIAFPIPSVLSLVAIPVLFNCREAGAR